MTGTESNDGWRRAAGQTGVVVAGAGLLAGLLGILRGAARRETVLPRVDELPEFRFRPPGALSEAEFLARCIHCWMCQDVCPADCIEMSADAGREYDTPFVRPRFKGCTLCLKCGQVCPTGALQPVERKSDARMGVAEVDEQLCVSHLRTGACGACFTACPLRGEAITQGLFNAPTVHPESCTGCGLCEEMCIVAYRAIRVRPRRTEETAT